MRRFAALYAELDETNKTGDKVAAMQRYFAAAPAADAAWAVYFLTGRKPRQVISSKHLRAWSVAAGQIPEWLFERCHEAVGDLAETVALLLPEARAEHEALPLHAWVEQRLLTLPQLSEAEQQARMLAAWGQFGPTERLVWNKLITGAFRVGVSQTLVMRALSGMDCSFCATSSATR